MHDEYENSIITILDDSSTKSKFYAYYIETDKWSETDIDFPSTLSQGTTLCVIIQDPSLKRDFSEREIIIFADSANDTFGETIHY